MREMHMEVTGRVQGVWFRKTVKEHASQLSLFGYVMNKDDGSVEIVVQGEKNYLENFQKWVATSPGMSHVEEVCMTWRDVTKQYDSFVIRGQGWE